MEEKITKSKLNPIELINKLFKVEGVSNFRLSHVTFDESVNSDYDFRIIRSSTHDGTLLFTRELLKETLDPVVFRTAYSNSHYTEKELAEKVQDINYTIGDLIITNDFGIKTINGMNIPGQEETAYLPVKCNYVLK